MQINITNYESLLLASKQQAEPQRLLFVFLRASLPEARNGNEASSFHSSQDGGTNKCVEKAPDELSRFSDLVAESEKMEQDWQIVLVAGLSGKNGLTPNSEEVERSLNIMVETVQIGGDLSKYVAFDKHGIRYSPLSRPFFKILR